MTDACPIPFGAKLPLPPELLPFGFLWDYETAELELCLLFFTPMDTTLLPAPSDFIILADGVPKTPDSVAWFTDFLFQLTYSQPALNPTTVRLSLPESVGDFHSVNFIPVSPFDLLGQEQIATALWESSGSDFLIRITMNFAMIEQASANPTQLNVSFVGFDGNPDTVAISAAGVITLLILNENPPLGTLNLTFDPPHADYRKTNNLMLCPFTIANIMEAP